MDDELKPAPKKCESCGQELLPGQVVQLTITGFQCLPCWNLQVLDSIRRNKKDPKNGE